MTQAQARYRRPDAGEERSHAAAAPHARRRSSPAARRDAAARPADGGRNEADKDQLDLARRQGAAYVAQIDWERRGAAWSGTTDAADYRLVAAITPAGGQWARTGRTSRWTPAPAGLVHLRVLPQDWGSGRFVPGLAMRAQFLGTDRAVLGEVPLPFALYPATDAYGANVALPPGTARLAVRIDPMTMMRHDP